MRNESRKSHRKPVTLSLYSVTRCYGGAEEGGWWYDWYEHVRSLRPMKPCRAKRAMEREESRMGRRKSRRHLINSGPDMLWYSEEYPGQFRSTERPHYE